MENKLVKLSGPSDSRIPESIRAPLETLLDLDDPDYSQIEVAYALFSGEKPDQAFLFEYDQRNESMILSFLDDCEAFYV